MKLIATATALLLAGSAMAQTAPEQATPPADPAAASTAPAPATDPATPAPADSQAPDSQESASRDASAEVGTADPAGGYQPANPVAITGTPQPGVPMIVQPSPSPAEAFPAPPPLKSYPICKRGQFDDCMQRGG